MHQLWQACSPCKQSLLVWRCLTQSGTTTTSVSHRIGLKSCLTPCSVECRQARCLILACFQPFSKYTHIASLNKMSFTHSSAKQNEGFSSDGGKEEAPSDLKPSRSEPALVDLSKPCLAPNQIQSYSRYGFLPYVLPGSESHNMQEVNQKKQFHTASSSSNELQLDECTTETRKTASPEIGCWAPHLLYEQMQTLRQWEPAFRTHSAGVGEHQFTLMSYNVLAQRLLETNYDLYSHCDPDVLQWEYRSRNIIRELKESNSDILCLQEVQEDHYVDTFLPQLQEIGYTGIYKKRTSDKTDGCAIFYKNDAFALEAWLPVEFRKPGVDVLDRDNIAIVALFRPCNELQSNKRLCVATTHLLFNPKRGDVKLAQLQVLFAEMDRLAFKHLSNTGHPLYHPVILCGDMNSEPHSEIYKFVTAGALQYDGLPVSTMSGQTRGRWTTKYLTPELLPPYLGITDQCQFAVLHNDRMTKFFCHDMQKQQAQFCFGNIADNSFPEGYNTQTESPASDEQDIAYCNNRCNGAFASFSSGVTRHRFNLLSVYDHFLKRLPSAAEVTTHHTRAATTVDYIFHSVKNKHSFIYKNKLVHEHVKESNLKLLATYSLLSDKEVRNLGGLPNAVSSSDHLPLLAKFAL